MQIFDSSKTIITILEINICVSFIISRGNLFGQHSFSILSACMMDVRFRTPANFYVCGRSQCGKPHLVRSMLYHLEELFDPAPTKIISCYGEYQTVFNDMMYTTCLTVHLWKGCRKTCMIPTPLMKVRPTVLVISDLVLCTMLVLNPGLFRHDLNLRYEKL